MAQSTEEYLDSLLRQAMGVPEPEPEKKPDEIPDLPREDVFAMAEGLSGSTSAILGNAYDHNASFTNQGEIEIPVQPKVSGESVPQEPVIPADLMPDPDAPVSETGPASTPVYTEPVISDSFSDEPILPKITLEEPVVEEAPVMPEIPLPDGPVIEQDGNLDIIPHTVMEEIEAPVPEPVIEEPVIEEPVIEEPAIEEPVIEEPVIEEPAIEEPVIEEPAIEEPVIEEPVIEEPAIEEPVIEEPVTEEPVIEEPVAEPEPEPEPEPELEPEPEPESAGMSIDDLDPNDNMKALDADTIAALFASANAEESTEAEPAPEEETVAEEPAIEEPAAEEIPAEEAAIEEPAIEEEPEPVEEESEAVEEEPEAIGEEPEAVGEESETVEEESVTEEESEPPMEELVMPEDEDEGEEAPLMPDQEISELLSTLGELSGDTPEEEAPAEEALAEETAPGEETETVSSDTDLGIDMFDTDLSAMLDDVTGAVENEENAAPASSDDQDLNDLLGNLDDGSGDLSDIGNLLEKDENSELVDPNTETAEALFASDSEDELFNIDNLIDEEEEASGGRKKKKKKFSLFGKKKKKSDNVEIIGGDEEMLIDPDLLDIPDESEIKSKKKGFLSSFFAKLFEEVEEEESGASVIEQSAVDIAAEGAAENEAILSELDEEGAAKDKKKKKEKKKKEKKEKKGKKDAAAEGEGEEGEEGQKEEPKKKKKEKKKKEKLPEIPGKKLPRKKVVAIALFCITIGLVITFTAFLYPYSQDIKKAKKFYTTGEYQKTYEYMRGHKLTREDKILYDRTVTLLRIKRPYDSYQNYMKMGLRMEALNALVQGVQMIDTYAEDAATLGIIDKYSVLSRQIYDELYNTFGVTVDRARSWIELEGSPEYTRALYDALRGTSEAAQTPPDGAMEGSPESAPLPEGMEPADDSVINAEENDL